ncbi:MAG: signal peptidase I [Firmicutes bacterium]|nr:signal peptidase I [Bacillota bacterium]
MQKNRWRKAGSIIGSAVAVLFVAVALFLGYAFVQSKLTGSEPAVAGYRICYVMSGSMEPALKVGSAVVVQSLAAEEVRPGDIITYRSNNGSTLTTHRVERLDTTSGLLFYTKGDANKIADPLPVTEQQLVGKVALTVPYLGYLLAYAGTREGLLVLLALAVLIIAGGLIRTYKVEKMQYIRNAGGGVAAE